jgi:hypothetical protein
MTSSQRFYAEHGPISDPRAHRDVLAALEGDVAKLCETLHGIMIHRAWAPAYGWKFPDERMRDGQARTVSATLDRIFELDARPLEEAREPERRFAGTCRDFTLMLCAILRTRGVPARARCGFGRYFVDDRFEDHWVCEHWDAVEEQWVLTDSQIDALQRKATKLPFDPLDVPRSQFVVAGVAWDLCRSGREDPMKFGIFDMHGLWFVRGNVLRDLASLNRAEVLPWDDFGLMRDIAPEAEPTEAQWVLLDRAAALTTEPDTNFDEITSLYAAEPSLAVGDKVMNWQMGQLEAIPRS